MPIVQGNHQKMQSFHCSGSIKTLLRLILVGTNQVENVCAHALCGRAAGENREFFVDGPGYSLNSFLLIVNSLFKATVST